MVHLLCSYLDVEDPEALYRLHAGIEEGLWVSTWGIDVPFKKITQGRYHTKVGLDQACYSGLPVHIADGQSKNPSC